MSKSSIIGKILIKGDLILKSPLLIGDGEGETSENFRDVHILKNDNNEPFIPGTSICGVLRDWLTAINPDIVTKIFGDAEKMQSSIQIDDIILTGSEIIARDGVRIDNLTGTGVKGGKYDFEVLDRGATGKLRLLINLRGIHADEENSAPKKIVDVVKVLLKKLSDGIRLGALTSKGFGLVTAEKLNAAIYDFRKKFYRLPKTILPARKILSLMRSLNSIRRSSFVITMLARLIKKKIFLQSRSKVTVILSYPAQVLREFCAIAPNTFAINSVLIKIF